MKIESIRAIPLYGKAYEDWPARYGELEQTRTLVEVRTDAGLSSLGSVYTSGPLVSAALDLLRPLYTGASAIDPAATTEMLHQNTFWQGRGGSVTHTISGIDMALWDLLGQVTGQPIWRLLGGKYRDRIQPYASMLMVAPERMGERLLAAKERGFRAFKIGWGPFGRSAAGVDEAIVRAARTAIGDDCHLMVDAGASDAFWPHGFKWALEKSRMLKDYNVAWFEEALRPDDIDGYVELTRQSPVPIAAGEVLTRRQTFLPWIERHAVDYLQPDVTKVGGLSEQHRIGQYADDHNMLVVPHGWNTGVGLVVDLHLCAAAGNARWVEYLTPEPYLEDVFAQPFRLDGEGMLQIPQAAGYGVQWNWDGIAKLARG
ncbi:mandelate racemase/muconate lactonizing enzyme family protein [Bryobacter aggregatus]|uniref:mandelate racemase/muconate lactonizing enzyme family protein n=1 Tax=Bryobacter aggregatus TaxID=360054 RepID=UPI0004E1536D|nr:mandelate racemase/muconate lactonizing enzyme family protein [Bryobacter aggregatus]